MWAGGPLGRKYLCRPLSFGGLRLIVQPCSVSTIPLTNGTCRISRPALGQRGSTAFACNAFCKLGPIIRRLIGFQLQGSGPYVLRPVWTLRFPFTPPGITRLRGPTKPLRQPPRAPSRPPSGASGWSLMDPTPWGFPVLRSFHWYMLWPLPGAAAGCIFACSTQPYSAFPERVSVGSGLRMPFRGVLSRSLAFLRALHTSRCPPIS